MATTGAWLILGLVGVAVATFFGYRCSTASVDQGRLAAERRHGDQLRAELAELAAKMERLAEENEKLARSELGNRRRVQFMVHDFKTALSCIGGFADMLLEKPALQGDPETASAVACIRRQTHRMAGLVSDLLQLARLRECDAPPTEPVLATELLREAAGDVSISARPGCIALGDQHLLCPVVSANPQLLRRVLSNLISNAVKHNGPDTKVWLDARVDESGQTVVFSCRDNGAGIPPEILPSLFGEFATTDELFGGSSGLGLAFCKGTVEAHGGRIWCENSPQGAQFFFTIPVYEEHDRERQVCGSRPQAGRRSRAAVRRSGPVDPESGREPLPERRRAVFAG